jgi:hypothetical protein
MIIPKVNQIWQLVCFHSRLMSNNLAGHYCPTLPFKKGGGKLALRYHSSAAAGASSMGS